MKNFLGILLCILVASCSKTENQPGNYDGLYDFEQVTGGNHYTYLVPVVHSPISKESFVSAVKGKAWESSAVYKLRTDKSVISAVDLGEYPGMTSRIAFSDNGSQATFYALDLRGYETEKFSYEPSNGGIDFTYLWFSSFSGNGRLVYLSSSTMVLVCTHDKDSKGENLIFMEILNRVPDSTLATWQKSCTHKGINE